MRIGGVSSVARLLGVYSIALLFLAVTAPLSQNPRIVGAATSALEDNDNSHAASSKLASVDSEQDKDGETRWTVQTEEAATDSPTLSLRKQLPDAAVRETVPREWSEERENEQEDDEEKVKEKVKVKEEGEEEANSTLSSQTETDFSTSLASDLSAAQRLVESESAETEISLHGSSEGFADARRSRLPLGRENIQAKESQTASSPLSANIAASDSAPKTRNSLQSGASADPPVLWRDSRESLFCQVTNNCPERAGAASGDNVYPAGVSSVSDANFDLHFDSLFSHPSLQQVAFFPVLGNHDYLGEPQAQIEKFYSECRDCRVSADANGVGVRWRLPNAWYFSRVVFHDSPEDFVDAPEGLTHIASLAQEVEATTSRTDEKAVSSEGSLVVVNLHLDSNLWIAEEDSDGFAFLQWQFLRNALRAAQTDADWLFVHLHHPLASAGNPSRLSPRLSQQLLPVLFEFKVDALFAGHEHLISLFEFENGEAKIPQVIVGSGAKLFPAKECCSAGSSPLHCRGGGALGSASSGGTCDDPRCKMQFARPGFAVVQLTRRRMRVLLVEAATGVILGEAVYGSKKSTRQRSEGSVALRDAASDGQSRVSESVDANYPPIVRVVLKPRDTHGENCLKWSNRLVTLWLMLFFLAAAVCLAVYPSRCCLCLQRATAFLSFRWKRLRDWRGESAVKGAVPLPENDLAEVHSWQLQSPRCGASSRSPWTED